MLNPTEAGGYRYYYSKRECDFDGVQQCVTWGRRSVLDCLVLYTEPTPGPEVQGKGEGCHS